MSGIWKVIRYLASTKVNTAFSFVSSNKTKGKDGSELRWAELQSPGNNVTVRKRLSGIDVGYERSGDGSSFSKPEQ